MRIKFIISLLPILLGGCATKWENINSPLISYGEDLQYCKHSRQMVPDQVDKCMYDRGWRMVKDTPAAPLSKDAPWKFDSLTEPAYKGVMLSIAVNKTKVVQKQYVVTSNYGRTKIPFVYQGETIIADCGKEKISPVQEEGSCLISRNGKVITTLPMRIFQY